MMKRTVWFLAALACAVLIAAPMFAAGQKEGEKPTAEKPMLIKMVKEGVVGFPQESAILKYIGEKNNIVFECETPPSSSYWERLNLIMASGDLPDLVQCRDNEQFWNWVENGLVLSLDKYLEKTPNIREVVSAVRFNRERRIEDGKIYGIPRPEPIWVSGIYWRKDWLDKLGLSVPQTIDECATAWVKMASSDFDGNGVKDTYGFSMDPNTDYVYDCLFPALGVTGSNKTGKFWMLDKKGKVTCLYLLENYVQGIMFLANLYRQGVIDREYILNRAETDVQQKIQRGQTGSYMWWPMQNSWLNAKKKTEEINLGAQVVFTPPPKGPGGQGAWVDPSGSGNLHFLTSAVKDPARLMAFLDLMHTKNWDSIMKFGIPGVHYQSLDYEKAVIVRTEAQEYYYSDIAAGYYPKSLKQLDQQMPDWRFDIRAVANKIIIGEGTESDLLSLISKIRTAGLDNAVAEMQQHYNNTKR
jgi:putative aldouronate transport system substrate-binding protein